MPNQQSHIRIVREWCQSLGILSAVSISRAEAEMKLAAYVPLLVREFPDAAFTADSLSHCARAAIKGFPTYGELMHSLGEWWREHRPTPPALPPPEPLPFHVPTPEELAHIRACVEEVTARVSAHADEAAAASRFGARHLSPGVLDQINPLPNGRKRVMEGVS